MKTETQFISGDTTNVEYALRIVRFAGTGHGPTVYMQAGLHAQELPGFVAIERLLPLLETAEAEGRIRSKITLVPHANPIGQAQALFHDNLGRFDFHARTNFNRSFPLPGGPTYDPQLGTAVAFLKSTLMDLSEDADIVLDLHCDDEGPVYLYVPDACWPEAQKLGDALGAVAVLTWIGEGGGAFEDAVIKRWLATHAGRPLTGKVVSTVELRGMLDVDTDLADTDAAGLYAYLVAIGAVEDQLAAKASTNPVVQDQTHVDMIKAPMAGAILYRVKPGDIVVAGQTIAEIVPGDSRIPSYDILAPRAGLVLTRRARRYARRGDDIAKIVCDSPSSELPGGPLEP